MQPDVFAKWVPRLHGVLGHRGLEISSLPAFQPSPACFPFQPSLTELSRDPGHTHSRLGDKPIGAVRVAFRTRHAHLVCSRACFGPWLARLRERTPHGYTVLTHQTPALPGPRSQDRRSLTRGSARPRVGFQPLSARSKGSAGADLPHFPPKSRRTGWWLQSNSASSSILCVEGWRLPSPPHRWAERLRAGGDRGAA